MVLLLKIKRNPAVCRKVAWCLKLMFLCGSWLQIKSPRTVNGFSNNPLDVEHSNYSLFLKTTLIFFFWAGSWMLLTQLCVHLQRITLWTGLLLSDPWWQSGWLKALCVRGQECGRKAPVCVAQWCDLSLRGSRWTEMFLKDAWQQTALHTQR